MTSLQMKFYSTLLKQHWLSNYSNTEALELPILHIVLGYLFNTQTCDQFTSLGDYQL